MTTQQSPLLTYLDNLAYKGAKIIWGEFIEEYFDLLERMAAGEAVALNWTSNITRRTEHLWGAYLTTEPQTFSFLTLYYLAESFREDVYKYKNGEPQE
jgi:hypothetical protein